ncbi:hypothetical protein Clacol_007060 [Clathrus columnatus]|uniref:F-box domain-containing protein n=1 Tax=Clathrus columnatus TaxID=1419009 RepID=A0AAV5AIZ0_9AGAM|nr:hypothetical protein Clacol_007060 [Clathrus columnatus]
MSYPEALPIHNIWDEIAFLLESTKDLLSFALTCRVFKELIIPDHLEYRYIRCDLRRQDVWKFLASRPRLARGIKTVELISDPHETDRLPQTFGNAPGQMLQYGIDTSIQITDEHMEFFGNALSNMVFLNTFVWKQEPASHQGINNIFHILANKTRCLEALSMWTLTGLTKLTIRRPNFPAIQMIVHLCSELKDLDLWELTGAAAYYLMQYANLKYLGRLTLMLDLPSFSSEGDNISMVMTPFLDRHSTLVSLHLIGRTIPIPIMPASCLPKLHSIALTNTDISLQLSYLLSDEILSRLVHWQCPVTSVDISTLTQLDKLVSLYNTEEIFVKDFTPFLSKTPNLKRVFSKFVDYRRSRGDDAQEKLITALLQCTNLTHIFCDFRLTTGKKRASESTEKLRHLCESLSALPNLKYFEVTLNNKRQYVGLERDETGLYSGYHIATWEESHHDLEGGLQDILDLFPLPPTHIPIPKDRGSNETLNDPRSEGPAKSHSNPNPEAQLLTISDGYAAAHSPTDSISKRTLVPSMFTSSPRRKTKVKATINKILSLISIKNSGTSKSGPEDSEKRGLGKTVKPHLSMPMLRVRTKSVGSALPSYRHSFIHPLSSRDYHKTVV